MKKIIICMLLALSLCTAALADEMMVHITSVCPDPNHVGTQWAAEYYIGDLRVYDGSIVDLDAAKYDLYTLIGDYDASPETGYAEDVLNVTQTRLDEGFSVEQYLTVKENQGRYRDYWCEWYITYTFIPIGGGIALN